MVRRGKKESNRYTHYNYFIFLLTQLFSINHHHVFLHVQQATVMWVIRLTRIHNGINLQLGVVINAKTLLIVKARPSWVKNYEKSVVSCPSTLCENFVVFLCFIFWMLLLLLNKYAKRVVWPLFECCWTIAEGADMYTSHLLFIFSAWCISEQMDRLASLGFRFGPTQVDFDTRFVQISE